jgi:hypothetical protein
MVRLRNALVIVAMAAGAFGCAHWGGSGHNDYAHWSIFHCSQCDDFPAPTYGPNYSMMPGSYAGPRAESEASTRMSTPTSSNAPVVSAEAAVPPPTERPGTPSEEPPTTVPTPPAPPPANNPNP